MSKKYYCSRNNDLYSTESESIAKMEKLMEERNLVKNGSHHEIYLSDPRKVPDEKLKNMLRHCEGKEMNINFCNGLGHFITTFIALPHCIRALDTRHTATCLGENAKEGKGNVIYF